MSAEARDAAAGRLKVFVSYSRTDVDFADQLVLALTDKGFDPLLDRHDIDAAEKWKERLGALILSCDTVVFVLTEKSAGSPICGWEVEEAARLGKRMIPVTPHAPQGVSPPPALTELNYITFYRDPAIPGSGFYDGVQKLERALSVDLAWLRMQTRLSEQAAEWSRAKPDDLLLRGVALDEALAWRARTPKGATVSSAVSEYLNASEIAEARRRAEAAAHVTERQEALAKAEIATRNTQRVTLIGFGVAMALTLLAGWMSWSAAGAAHDAAENRAAIFASEADNRTRSGHYAEAILAALAGDPAARRAGWIEGAFFAKDGYASARTALVAAFMHNNVERVFTGHSGLVTSLAVSRGGKRVLTGSVDGWARLFDAETGRELRRYGPHEDGVFTVTFSNDGRRVLTGGRAGAVLWDIETAQAIRTFSTNNGAVRHAEFARDGRQIVFADYSYVYVWSIDAEQPVGAFATHNGAMALSPNGRFLAIATSADDVILFDLINRREVRRWQMSDRASNFADVTALVFGPRFYTTTTVTRGATTTTTRSVRPGWDADLPVGSAGNVVQELAVGYGQNIYVFGDGTEPIHTYGGHRGAIHALEFSSDGRLLLSGSEDGSVRLWDPDGETRMFQSERTQHLSVSFAPDGLHILSAWDGNTARLWKLDTRTDSARPINSARSSSGNDYYSANGRWRLSTRLITIPGSNPPRPTYQAELFDSITGRIRQTFVLPERLYPSEVAFSADGGRALIIGQYQTLLFSVAGARVVREFREQMRDAILSPDGRWIAMRGSEQTARILDAETGRESRAIDANARIRAFTATPDGRNLVIGTDVGAQIWDVQRGTLLHRLGDQPVFAFAFSRDGSLLATSGGVLALWNVGNGTSLQTFRGASESRAVAISENGNLVVASHEGQLILWDVASGSSLQSFDAGYGFLSGLAFVSDGRSIVSHSRQNTWQIAPIVLASPAEQVEMACATLSSLGAAEYSEADFQRFPSLRGQRPCPQQARR